MYTTDWKIGTGKGSFLWSGFLFLMFIIAAPGNLLAEINENELQQESARILGDILRLDTTNPPGNESLVADYLERLFRREGITCLRLARDEGRDNVIARYHGSGEHDPILLYSHSDVVGADQGWGTWSVEPFSGIVQDGAVFGRGAIDAKGLLVSHLMAMLLLKRENVSLDRDVIFLAAAAEETGGGPGIAWLLDEHRDIIDAEVALGEGGRVWERADSVWAVWLQAGEKAAHNLTVQVEGEAAHSSVPSSRNAIDLLTGALQRIRQYSFAERFFPVTTTFFERMQPLDSRVRPGQPRYIAMTRTTVTVTMISGGVKSNVIPPYAEANLNLRLLPGDDLDSVITVLETAANCEGLTINRQPWATSRASVVPFDTPFFETIEQAALDQWPTAVVTPYLSPGTSDASKLRDAGILTYGVMPFPLTAEESSTVHGVDEHVRIESLADGILFTYNTLLLWANGRIP